MHSRTGSSALYQIINCFQSKAPDYKNYKDVKILEDIAAFKSLPIIITSAGTQGRVRARGGGGREERVIVIITAMLRPPNVTFRSEVT